MVQQQWCGKLNPHNENCLARLWLFKAVPVDSGRDTKLRNFEHTDGDCLPRRDEMDHQRRSTSESTGQIAAAHLAGGSGVPFTKRIQYAADHLKQYLSSVY